MKQKILQNAITATMRTQSHMSLFLVFFVAHRVTGTITDPETRCYQWGPTDTTAPLTCEPNYRVINGCCSCPSGFESDCAGGALFILNHNFCICDNDNFYSVGSSSTSGECSPCGSCQSTQFETQACGRTSQTQCADCTGGGPGVCIKKDCNYDCVDNTVNITSPAEDSGEACPTECSSGPASTGDASRSGDPHLHLAHGGVADFRGRNGTYYALLSAPGVHLAAKTTDTDFLLPRPQLVHGSFFTAVAWVVRGVSGTVYGVASDANRVGVRVTNLQTGRLVADKEGVWQEWWEDGHSWS